MYLFLPIQITREKEGGKKKRGRRRIFGKSPFTINHHNQTRMGTCSPLWGSIKILQLVSLCEDFPNVFPTRERVYKPRPGKLLDCTTRIRRRACSRKRPNHPNHTPLRRPGPPKPSGPCPKHSSSPPCPVGPSTPDARRPRS